MSAFLPVIAGLITIVLTILLLCLVVPEKKRDKLPKFFRSLHDIFNFKGLLIEAILKAIYVFTTVGAVVMSFVTFCYGIYYAAVPPSYKDALGRVHVMSRAPAVGYIVGGLIALVVAPILIRLTFEFLMMLILLVKNVISINNKMKNQNEKPEQSASSAQAPYAYPNATAWQAPSAPQGSPVRQAPAATQVNPAWQAPATPQPTPVRPAPTTPQATPVKQDPVVPQSEPARQVPKAPAEPIAHVEPVAPVEPVTPIEPVAPVEPVMPAEPVIPVKPTSESTAVFCTNCGNKFEDDAEFCSHCGAKR